MAQSPSPDPFVWHELMTSDVESAGRFYSKVIGWKTQKAAEMPSYRLFMSGKHGVAGLLPMTDTATAAGAGPGWLSYVGTPDADDTARKAERLGGKVLVPGTDVPKVGRWTVLQDPQGAVFAAFTPAGAPAEPPPSAFSWHELATVDWKAALSFYQSLFGWEATNAMDMGALGTYQMFGVKGRTLGGMFNKPADMKAPPFWLPYIGVDDARRLVSVIQKLSGSVMNGPTEVPGGDWIVQAADGQGAFFAVHSRKPAEKAAGRRTARQTQAAGRAAKKPASRASKPAGKSAGKSARKPARAAAGARAGQVAKKKAAPRSMKKSAPRRQAAKAGRRR